MLEAIIAGLGITFLMLMALGAMLKLVFGLVLAVVWCSPRLQRWLFNSDAPLWQLLKRVNK